VRLTGVCALALALTVAACTTAPSAGPGTGATPTVDAPGRSVSPQQPAGGAPSDAEPRTQPLVLVTHATRLPLDVFEEVALRIIRGDVHSWAELGVPGVPGEGPEPGSGPTRLHVVAAPGTPAPGRLELGSARAAVRAVFHDRDTVAVVPASAVGAEVRPMLVNGFHPMREPAKYPLRTRLPRAADAPGPVVTMTVVGDIMLGRGVARAAAAGPQGGGVAPALRPTRDRLAAADITVGNLESTLSRAGAPTQGGDSFAADPRAVRGLRSSGFDALSLANNHVGDFGDRALVQTVRRLRAAGLATFGAGKGPGQARAPAVVQRRGTTYAFLGFNAIGETPAVAPGQPGAVTVSMPPRTGPLDRAELARFLRSVRRVDRAVDVVVVLPHWGTQYTNEPEPVQRRVARRLVSAGADLVVGGHPHWVQGVDVVDGVLVAHSLGNFVFDMDFMQETQEGLILELTYWGARLKAADFVPYVMDDTFAPRVVPYRHGLDVLWRMRATSGVSYRG
jgi:poly-gamma-glutamate capsule biosynthesis protein CapA/YwtB (metallophosphatase superfamily)